MNFHTADAAFGEHGERNRPTTAPFLSLTLGQEQCPYEWRGSIQVYQDFAIYPLRDKTPNQVGLFDPRRYPQHKTPTDLVRKERLDILRYFDGDQYV